MSLDVLDTARLRGERIAPGHASAFARILSDPVAMTTLGGLVDGAAAQRRLENSIAHWSAHGFGKWLLFDRGSGEAAGYVGVQRCEVEGTPEVELAYALLPDFWGRGLASEAARAAVCVAFADLALARLVCFTLPTNAASRRVVEAAGFGYERDIVHAGVNHVLYCQFRSRTGH